MTCQIITKRSFGVDLAVKALCIRRTRTEADGGGRRRMDADGRGRTRTDADGGGRTRTEADGRGRRRTDADGGGRTRTEADGRGRRRTDADGGGRTRTEADGRGRTRTDVDGRGHFYKIIYIIFFCVFFLAYIDLRGQWERDPESDRLGPPPRIMIL